MVKKLLKRYVVEIFEIDNSITLDKNETKNDLAKVVKEKISIDDKIKLLRALKDKRKKELDDYFGWKLPHNLKEKKNESGTQKETE